MVAPAERRLQRIMQRDGLTEAQARERMAAQQGEEFYIARADRVIYNDGSLEALHAAANALADDIREWSHG